MEKKAKKTIPIDEGVKEEYEEPEPKDDGDDDDGFYACLNLNRKFIGIELEQKYVDICNKRIMEVKSGENANYDGIPPNNKLLGILPTIL
jgi:hypothetical protein